MLHCVRRASLLVLGSAGLLLSLGSVTPPAVASTWDGRPKLLLHVRSVTTKNTCTAGALSDCQSAVTEGQVATVGSGPFYFVYLLAAGGMNASSAGIAGVEVGIQYQNGLYGDMDDGQGIDIFGWAFCATLEFQTPSPGWLRPGGGNMITWDSVNRCQRGDTGVAGYFYLACYAQDDALWLTPRPVSGYAKVANCSSIESQLNATELGKVVFSSSGMAPGCNPCEQPCPTGASGDLIPPDAIVLTTDWVDRDYFRLAWAAPEDHGGSRSQVAAYDLRYSTSPIIEQNFESALYPSYPPTPAPPGTIQTKSIWNLQIQTTYYAAIRSIDDAGNVSPLSNVVMVTTQGNETIPPAAVTDLAATGTTSSSITLTWTAPGDDGVVGTAYRYDIRWSLSPITSTNFTAAHAVSPVPRPTAPGTIQTCTVSGLTPNQTYYLALKTYDEQFNGSPLSNVVVATVGLLDIVPPAAVTTLAISTLSDTTATLTWSAPGDDSLSGVAAQYDLRYSESLITPGSFAAATLTSGEPAPASPGTLQGFTVTGLAASHTYYFALKTADEVPNWSGLSNVASGSTLPPAPPDTIPPAAIADLTVSSAGPGSATLEWTVPGDDGGTGWAAAYDLRYSTAPITPANFALLTRAATPAPGGPGTRQGCTVSNLVAGTTYYYAIKARDEALNWSGLSNVTSRTLPRTGQNNLAKIMLHLTSPRTGNGCASLGISQCSQFVTNGDLALPGSGPFYFAYLLSTNFGALAGLECGITYDGGNAGGMTDGSGIDIFSWNHCATIEFPSPVPAWPKPGSGNLLTWDSVNSCQTGFTAVAGWFYLAAYGPDELRVTPRPASGFAKVADCAAIETILPLNFLGSVQFSAGAAAHGENPCGRSQSVPVRHVTWSAIKTLVGQ